MTGPTHAGGAAGPTRASSPTPTEFVVDAGVAINLLLGTGQHPGMPAGDG